MFPVLLYAAQDKKARIVVPLLVFEVEQKRSHRKALKKGLLLDQKASRSLVRSQPRVKKLVSINRMLAL